MIDVVDLIGVYKPSGVALWKLRDGKTISTAYVGKDVPNPIESGSLCAEQMSRAVGEEEFIPYGHLSPDQIVDCWKLGQCYWADVSIKCVIDGCENDAVGKWCEFHSDVQQSAHFWETA